jgi:hypothetical protein
MAWIDIQAMPDKENVVIIQYIKALIFSKLFWINS